MTTKRTSLISQVKSQVSQSKDAQAKAPAAGPVPAVPATAAKPLGEMMTTAISLPRETWELLRDVAFARAKRSGGRASVSAVLVDLVKQHETALRQEVS